MPYDTEKVDRAVLALLHLCMHKAGPDTRAWKGFPWEAMERLHARGLISNPRSQAKSVVVSEEAVTESAHLFEEWFGKQD